MKAIRRYLPNLDTKEKLPPEIIEKLEVSLRDFMEALKSITPTAMREVYFEKPNVKMEDIGGLEEIRRN